MIENGRRVVVRYTGTLDDGTVFDTTDNKEPLEFEIGSGLVINGFDEAVREMEAGETKKVHIDAANAYGPRSESRIQQAPMYSIPNAKDIRVGKPFYFITEEGIPFPATVTEIHEGIATVDFNNPLADKELNFEIELLEIKDAD